MLSLELEDKDGRTILKLSDSTIGKIGHWGAGTKLDGWKQLFGIGLKGFVERGAQSILVHAEIESAHSAVVALGLRPLLRAVKNSIDLDDILADAIDSQERKPREHKLAGARFAAWAAAVRKLR